MASGPRCSIPRGGPLKVSWQQMAEDTSARAISSRTMEASTSPRPMPPHCSPTVMRSRSAAARALRTSADTAPSSSAWCARGATSRSATSRASWRSAAWSSVSASRSTPGPVLAPCRSSAELGADDADEADALARGAAQVVGQPERPSGPTVAIWRSGGASPRSCSQHSKSMRSPEAPIGCPKDFSPPSGLTGSSPSRSKVPAEHLLPRRAPLGEAEVLHEDELGRREAVVHLGHGQLRPGVGDPGLRVGVGGRAHDLLEGRVVVGGVDRAGGRAGHEGQRLHVERVVAVACGRPRPGR